MISKLGLFIAALLLAQVAPLLAQSTLAVVAEHGTRSQRINMVFLSEGYTSSDMTKYATDVQSVVTYLFGREPWVRYRSYCNVYRIEIASNESGTDNGDDHSGLRDTYFSTGFYNPGIPQSIVIGTTGSTRAYALLNKHVPEYDIVVVMVNDSKYGGSGGPLAVVTTDFRSAQILEHELGHSFAKLTDEYDAEYPGYPNIEYPNATAKTVRSQIRWNVWIDPTTDLPTAEGDFLFGGPFNQAIGLYEGANYHTTGWYRPHDNKLMRSLAQEPGSVTREAIVLNYYSRVTMIEGATPTATTLTYTTPTPLTFNLTTKVPSSGPALSTQWLIDNIAQSETSSTLTLSTKSIGNGTHTVKAIVRDTTDWVRRDPTGLMVEEKSWTLKLSNQTDPPVITNALPASRVLSIGSGFQLDATATGPGPITYLWLKNNVPFSPAITAPTLTIATLAIPHAGTYTVKVTNPGHTLTQNCNLAVVDPYHTIPLTVVAQGHTATLSFNASANLPPVTWSFKSSPLANGIHYANATTRALQIKNVTTTDTGPYYFSSGDFTTVNPLNLRVVTGKPDYTSQTVTLKAGIIGGSYSDSVAWPTDTLLSPNTFSALGLPKGLILNATNGAISGTPTVASKDQVQGDEVTFTVGNEFGKVTLKVRLLIKPLPPGVEGSFSGPIYLYSQLGSNTGGMMNVTITSTGAYTGSAVIGTETLPFSGSVFTSGPTATSAIGGIVLKPKHLSSALFITFQITDYGDADPATASLVGYDSIGTDFVLWRNKWVPPEAADSFAGYHTFYFPVSTNANAPKGYGFGSVAIDSNGKTTVVGKVADGSVFTTSSLLSPEGTAFVYQTLYATPTKGSFIALLDLDVGATVTFGGNSVTNWFRPADTSLTARAFNTGFGPETMKPVGGRYEPPAKTAIPMGLNPGTGMPPANAQLAFQSLIGDDPVSVNPNVTLNLKVGSTVTVNTPNPKATTFTITPTDGRFQGSYTTVDADPRGAPHPAIKRVVPYQGIIVPVPTGLQGFGQHLRYALPKADGSTTTLTSPLGSGTVNLQQTP